MSALTKQLALFRETAALAFDTLRSHKMRSALTVLGVVIGVTSIVGMTSLIRGFDSSLRDSINTLGPNTVYVQRFGGLSFASGASFMQLMRRPLVTSDDMHAIERNATTVGMVDLWLSGGVGGPGQANERMFYRGQRTRPVPIMGTTERYVDINFAEMVAGRSFTEQEALRGRAVVVIGYGPYQALFQSRGIDPIGKSIRVGAKEYTVLGVIGKRPSPGGFRAADDFAIIPYPAFRKQFGSEKVRRQFGGIFAMIPVLPKEGVSRDDMMREVEAIMRIRHGLTLDQPNDFDLVTSDAVLAVWDQISAAILLALVVISSIALMVGGIGVMAIMTISVTERTREIGVRKAIGARRLEILVQFLIEAAVLTSVGGILGVLMGSAIGLGVNLISGFPVSLPWWSFALGLGFSAGIGIFFGMLPAWRASRLDPIEALRYE
ncbi:MAG: FtsX-like permease family protein [Acidimicrobiia bacterium]|nr:FtsX-like permease family protein [Acidimicrobiia bacterium]